MLAPKFPMEDPSSSSDDGKEKIIILSGNDHPRRIDCGPKSCNVSRYRRDYYVNSDNFSSNDVLGFDLPKRQDSREPAAGDVVEKTKALLFAKQVSAEEPRVRNEASHLSDHQVSRSFLVYPLECKICF